MRVMMIGSLVFGLVWMLTDCFYLKCHNPLSTGNWHGTFSSLVIMLTAVWGLTEIHFLREELEKRSCRFKIFKLMTWFSFIFVTFIEVIVLTLLLFFRNDKVPEGFDPSDVTIS